MTMKTCRKCGYVGDQFYPARRACKECVKQAVEARRVSDFVSDPNKVRSLRSASYAKNRECLLAKREHMKNLVRAAKRGPCMDCGGVFPPEAMDFDHRDPSSKIMAVGDLLNSTTQWGRVESEIKKCDLVCANCHRLRTAPLKTKYYGQRMLIVKAKSRPCGNCGRHFATVAMDLAHVSREGKKFDVSKAVYDHLESSEIVAEIAKCKVLCACCHRIETKAKSEWMPHAS